MLLILSSSVNVYNLVEGPHSYKPLDRFLLRLVHNYFAHFECSHIQQRCEIE